MLGEFDLPGVVLGILLRTPILHLKTRDIRLPARNPSDRKMAQDRTCEWLALLWLGLGVAQKPQFCKNRVFISSDWWFVGKKSTLFERSTSWIRKLPGGVGLFHTKGWGQMILPSLETAGKTNFARISQEVLLGYPGCWRAFRKVYEKESLRSYFGPYIRTPRAKGTLISEPRFSTPCEMRFFPREKGKKASSKKNPRQRSFSLSRVGKIAPRRG